MKENQIRAPEISSLLSTKMKNSKRIKIRTNLNCKTKVY